MSAPVSPHELTKDRTLWVFVSDSDEPRHLHDIVFGVAVLRGRGVPDDRILVFTDHPTPGPFLSPYKISASKLAELSPAMLGVANSDAVVLTVTGHGGIEGIGAKGPVVTPHGLLGVVRSVPGLKAAVIVVCQCFAGIFDQLDAGSDPPIVLMGATRLNNSLSNTTTLAVPIVQADGSAGLTTWGANIFMLSFFDWIKKPVDIDGDSKLTMLDAYKYAGVLSNKRLISIKSRLYLEIGQLAPQVAQLALAGMADPVATLRLQATLQALQQKLETLHLHQEAWILHANLARSVSVGF